MALTSSEFHLLPGHISDANFHLSSWKKCSDIQQISSVNIPFIFLLWQTLLSEFQTSMGLWNQIGKSVFIIIQFLNKETKHMSSWNSRSCLSKLAIRKLTCFLFLYSTHYWQSCHFKMSKSKNLKPEKRADIFSQCRTTSRRKPRQYKFCNTKTKTLLSHVQILGKNLARPYKILNLGMI